MHDSATEATGPTSLLTSARGIIGRGDLLRWLATRGFSSDDESLAWLPIDLGQNAIGYARGPEIVESNRVDLTIGTPPPVSPPTPPSPHSFDVGVARRVRMLRAIVARSSPEMERAVDQSASTGGGAASAPDGSDEERDRRLTVVRVPERAPLVPYARLRPALQRVLSGSRDGSLDIARLIKNVTERLDPGRLPRKRVVRWPLELVAYLDLSPRLRPYHKDMHDLAAELVNQVVTSAISIRSLRDGDPLGPWTDWLDRVRGLEETPERFSAPRAASAPPSGVRVLVVTDLGLFTPNASSERSRWSRFLEAMVSAGHRPVALVPAKAGAIDPVKWRGVTLLRWSPDGRLRPERSRGAADPGFDESVEDLIAAIAVLRRVDPPLLRALRLGSRHTPLDAGLEGSIWNHPHISAGWFASVKRDWEEFHAARFRTLPLEWQQRVDAARCVYHAGRFGDAMSHELALRMVAHSRPNAVDPTAVSAAEEWLRALLAGAVPSDGDPGATDAVESARWIARRVDSRTYRRWREQYESLVRATLAETGEALPDDLDPSLADEEIRRRDRRLVHLVEDHHAKTVRLHDGPVSSTVRSLGRPFVIDGARLRVRRAIEPDRFGAWRASARIEGVISAADDRTAIEIETSITRLRVQTVMRPLGAEGWARTSDGITVKTAPIGPHRGEWTPNELQFVTIARGPDAGRSSIIAPMTTLKPLAKTTGVMFGIDPEHGVFAHVVVQGRRGTATQRFRWMEPGSFVMGSPEGELEREDIEGPQHRVTLTRGFWLGETACTQAFWQAVTGENPSEFKGVDRPVENVSWEDVDGFITALESLLPGCGADLPTEAEWEYACRAGTATPFWFGRTITPEQVNYNGNYPYAGGAKGEYREQTVAVWSLPPNGWGLFEMHGNVWEWCKDGVRKYTERDVVDPEGGVDGDLVYGGPLRAVRGGSWLDFARRARSAYRSANVPGIRDGYLGFRLALRSASSDSGRV